MRPFLFIALLTHIVMAVAASPTDNLKISDAWVKTSIPGSKVSAAYLRIESAAPIKLIKADSPVAGESEVHEMTMKQGVMAMQERTAVEIKPGQAVQFKPGGLHIMLMQVKAPIKKGDQVPLTLTFIGSNNKPFKTTVTAVARESN